MANIYQLPDETGINFTEGPQQIFVYVASQVPIFIPMVLILFFMVIAVGGYFQQQRRTGNGDFSMWFAVGGFMTTILATLFSLVDGLMPISSLVICIGVTILGAIWFLSSRD